MQKFHAGINTLKVVKDVVDSLQATRPMFITGRSSFINSGAMDVIKEIFGKQSLIFYNDFDPNPQYADALKASKLAAHENVDLIICIGGGSAIDMAKLVKAFLLTPENALKIATGRNAVTDPEVPIIAAPTTAGSGSESTHFAVVYVDGVKYSVASPCLLPNEVILDGSLTLSATRYQKACNVLDSFSQAIESAWSLGATEETQSLAIESLRLGVNVYQQFLSPSVTAEIAQTMLEAANLAGQAINATKTTAAHAWSYEISSRYGIPHGHAVWCTLPKIFEIHENAYQYNLHNDSFRSEQMRSIIEKLRVVLGVKPEDNSYNFFIQMLLSMGITRTSITQIAPSIDERRSLAAAVNKERMANNPVSFTDEQTSLIFDI